MIANRQATMTGVLTHLLPIPNGFIINNVRIAIIPVLLITIPVECAMRIFQLPPLS